MSKANPIDALMARYDRYSECDEWHVHNPEDLENNSQFPRSELENFDEEAFKKSLLAEVLKVLPAKKDVDKIESINGLKIVLRGNSVQLRSVLIGYNAAVDELRKAYTELFGGEV